MTYNESSELDYQYARIDNEQAKSLVIKHTSDRWETAKSLLTRLAYVIGLALLVYIFWEIWGIYFWIAFFASLPFTYFVAKKLVRIPIRWFLQIDVKQPKFNIFGIPKSWAWTGDALPATDNADNAISVVRSIDTSVFRTVKTTMSIGDFDRLKFINDAKTLDRVVEDKERLTAHVHYIRRNFWNAVIKTFGDMQEASVAKPIYEILNKGLIDLDMHPSVGKRSATETPKGEDNNE